MNLRYYLGRITLAASFRELNIGPILQGGYVYSLAAENPGWEPVRGEVTLRETERWETVVAYPTTAGDEIRANPQAGGVITPPPLGHANWVRLTGLFDGRVVEQVPLSANGAFHFYHVHEGRFLIQVFSDAESVLTREITVDRQTVFPIRLEVRR
jgi:hypothetical protein